jgi:hypothetical protein
LPARDKNINVFNADAVVAKDRAQEEQIPGTKLGKEWRFRKSILDEWIDSSILLSKAGFDLIVRSSQRAVRDQGFSPEQLERLIREARE